MKDSDFQLLKINCSKLNSADNPYSYQFNYTDYQLLIGKYGFYFFDTITGNDLTLMDVLKLLNKYASMKDELKKIHDALKDFPSDNQGDTTTIVDKGNYDAIIESLKQLLL